MIMFIRLFYKLLFSFLRPKIKVFDRSDIYFRVLPFFDSEYTMLNAARYFNYTEIAGAERNLRCGLLKTYFTKQWWVVAVAQKINYIRRIRIFDKVRLCSNMLGWDEKFFYWEWTFYCRGQLAAIAYTKCAVRSKAGAVSSKTICDLMGEDHSARPIDPGVQKSLFVPEQAQAEFGLRP
jgi:acyl-CoA thioesterase FadM